MQRSENEIKKLELAYFANLNLKKSMLFGGTKGSSTGSIRASAISSNGKLFAQSLSNGAILVYDTQNFFQLIRIYEGNPHTQFIHIEFSSDNSS